MSKSATSTNEQCWASLDMALDTAEEYKLRVSAESGRKEGENEEVAGV